MTTRTHQYLPRTFAWLPCCALFTLLAASSVCMAQKGFRQTGIASFYAHEFDGRRTANGELFDMDALTAAHQTLPFNTIVKVTNLDNGRTVKVRINDEGPFVDGRIIDLSRGAARALGMEENGTARVQLDVVSLPTKKQHEDDFFSIDIRRAPQAGFAVQLASFGDLANLLRQVDRLKLAGVNDVYVRLGSAGREPVYRLTSRGFPDRRDAEALAASLKKRGVTAFVFKIR